MSDFATIAISQHLRATLCLLSVKLHCGNKVKVGDLVELSASAKKLKWASFYSSRVGYVIDARYEHYIIVQWMGLPKIPFKESFSRSQLKYAKVKKR